MRLTAGEPRLFNQESDRSRVTVASGSAVTYRRGLSGGAVGTLNAGDSVVLDSPMWLESAGDSEVYESDGHERPVEAGNAGGVTMTGVGDSITARGHVDPVRASLSVSDEWYGQIDPKNWLVWAMLQSAGKLRYRGMAAQTNYKTAQILSEHVPKVLAANPRPSLCTVLAGTNDLFFGTPDPPATTQANLTAIYTQLAGAGILPVLHTLTPRGDQLASLASVVRLNNWIARQAALNGWPLVDLFGATVDPATGGWQAGFASDNIHPTSAGAKVMGKTLADALKPWLPPIDPLLASAPDAFALSGNPLMKDTNADGTPDGWQAYSGAPVMSVAADAVNVKGNWFKVTRGATDCQAVTTATFPAVAGNRVLYTAKVATTVEATASTALVRVTTGGVGPGELFSLWNFDKDIPVGSVIAIEAVVPPGFGGSTIAARLGVLGTAANGVVQAGQATVADLTAAGLA